MIRDSFPSRPHDTVLALAAMRSADSFAVPVAAMRTSHDRRNMRATRFRWVEAAIAPRDLLAAKSVSKTARREVVIALAHLAQKFAYKLL